MKKFILLLVATLSFSAGTFAGDTAVSGTTPAAADPNEPNAMGPKKSRKELKKEVREQLKAKREMLHAKILEACGPDLQTAGCSGKTGGDMMQCMRLYKESHPDFKMSDACREAHGEKKEFKKEARKMKKEMRHKIHQGMGHGGPASGTTTSP